MEKYYKIEQPAKIDLNSEKLPAILKYNELLEKTDKEYLHWQDLKYKTWLPGDKAEFWQIVKCYRSMHSIKTPVSDENGKNFSIKLNHYASFLHKIDKEMGGNLIGIQDFSAQDKLKFINRSLIEEAISSSKLEGANTSREIAKRMLLEARRPKDKSEQMIVNNHKTMKLIEEHLKNQELSLELLFSLHKMITENTIDDNLQGRLRDTCDNKGNRLVIKPWDQHTIAYVTPTREFVEKELPKLLDFANNKNDKEFIHPLIKAIILHFWIGLLHPFEDGNGRVARAIFYWYILRQDYWAFSYLSLSEKILKSPGKYAMAYIYSEQDDNDLTYFIDYNIKQIELARRNFTAYAEKTIQQNRTNTLLFQKLAGFNERQIKLLQQFNNKKLTYTSLVAYKNINTVGKITANTDLKKLVNHDLLIKQKRGRNVYYLPTEAIDILFK